MKRAILCSAMVLGLGYAPRALAAATCTVSGRLAVEPVDSYYCDTSVLGTACNLWWEKDLDSKDTDCLVEWCSTETGNAAPMPFARVLLGTTSGGGEYAITYADANGYWSSTFTASGWNGCNGHHIFVSFLFARVHEDDAGWIPGPESTRRFRFRVIDAAQLTWGEAFGVPLTGGLTRVYRTYQRELAGGDAITSAANVCYTVNSMMTKVVQWSTSLSNQFSSASWLAGTGMMRIRYDLGFFPTDSAGNVVLGLADFGAWLVDLHEATYDLGGLIRHEVGHMVQSAVHNRSQSWSCNSDSLANVAGRKATSCEWGFQAMLEGLPTFFAVRSITSNDTNVWFCQCADETNQDQCSEVASGAFGLDNDRIQNCPDTETWGWRGIGDAYAYSRDHCARVRKVEGCSYFTDTNQDGVWNAGETQYCPNASGGVCTDYWKHGHRNTQQIVRFFWDVLDVSNEAPLESYGHIDDTTLAMDGPGGLVSVFESMPCPGTGEGHCSEPSWQAPTCYPASATTSGTWWPMGFTRDAYNPYDFAQLIAGVDEGSATSELQLNCLGWAGD